MAFDIDLYTKKPTTYKKMCCLQLSKTQFTSKQTSQRHRGSSTAPNLVILFHPSLTIFLEPTCPLTHSLSFSLHVALLRRLAPPARSPHWPACAYNACELLLHLLARCRVAALPKLRARPTPRNIKRTNARARE